MVKGGMSSGCRFPICLTTSAGSSSKAVKSSCCVSCDSRLLVTPPRIFLGLRARAEPFFPEVFLLDKWRVVLMRRANLLGDRRFLDLVGIYVTLVSYFFSNNVEELHAERGTPTQLEELSDETPGRLDVHST